MLQNENELGTFLRKIKKTGVFGAKRTMERNLGNEVRDFGVGMLILIPNVTLV